MASSVLASVNRASNKGRSWLAQFTQVVLSEWINTQWLRAVNSAAGSARPSARVVSSRISHSSAALRARIRLRARPSSNVESSGFNSTSLAPASSAASLSIDWSPFPMASNGSCAVSAEALKASHRSAAPPPGRVSAQITRSGGLSCTAAKACCISSA